MKGKKKSDIFFNMNEKKTEKKSLYYNYIVLYTVTYGAMGGVFPLIGQYLDDIGFSGTQIGTITGAGTFAAIFATAFWGSVYNRARRKSGVVMLLCAVTAVIMAVLPSIRLYGLFLLAYAVMYFFQQPVNALSDAMVMEDGEKFNVIRMWGAIGYALAVFFAGRLANSLGTSIIFAVAVAGFAISLVFVGLIGRGRGELCALRQEANESSGKAEALTTVEAYDESAGEVSLKEASANVDVKPEHEACPKRKAGGYLELFTNRTYVKILIVAIFVGGTNVANNTYFSFLFEDAGGDLSGLGFTMLLMVGSEAPFMFLSARLSEKFTLEKMILFSIIISACRFLWYSTVPSTGLLTALFFLQGMVNGIILVEFIKYVAKVADSGSLGLAISAYYVVSSSISGIICQLLGGVMLDLAGGAGVYLLFGSMNVLAAVLYVVFGLHRKRA